MAKNKLVAPVLKWVGGKRQLLPAISNLLPKKKIKKYYEPFFGGGAVLFHLQPKNGVINDLNTELINVYSTIKEDVEALIADLKTHQNTSDYFYQIRALDRNSKFGKLSKTKKASRIIYLNKTCYNGLYRVNNSGEFNAPFGKYKNPNIINEITLRAVSNYLNDNDIEILNLQFDEILKDIPKESFVYFDPPYHPISKSSNFTGYVQGGFGEVDQIRLKNLCDDLNAREINFLLSNSAAPFITELYKDYNINFVKAKRAVNSNASKRGSVDEVLIRNYE